MFFSDIQFDLGFLKTARVYSQGYIPFAFYFTIILTAHRSFWNDYLIFDTRGLLLESCECLWNLLMFLIWNFLMFLWNASSDIISHLLILAINISFLLIWKIKCSLWIFKDWLCFSKSFKIFSKTVWWNLLFTKIFQELLMIFHIYFYKKFHRTMKNVSL